MISVANLYAAVLAAGVMTILAVLAYQLASAMEAYLPVRIGYNIYESVIDQLGDVGCIVIRDAALKAMRNRNFNKYVRAVSRVVAGWDSTLSRYGIHISLQIRNRETRYVVGFARFSHSVKYRVWVRCAVETLRIIDSIRVIRGRLPRFCAPVNGYVYGILHRVGNSSVFRGPATLYVAVDGGDLPCGDPIIRIRRRVILEMVLPSVNSSSVWAGFKIG